MLIGSSVPTTNSATSAMIETHSGPMGVLRRSRPARGPRRVTTLTCWLSGLANRSMGRLSIEWPHVSESGACPALLAHPALRAGGRADHGVDRRQRPQRRATGCPPSASSPQRLGVSRATLSQALVALEVIGVVAVRHGDGTVAGRGPGTAAHRRGDPRPRPPAARDHRDPRRARDQDRRPRRRPTHRRRPRPHRRRPRRDGRRHRGRRPRRRGRRALPRRRHRGRPLAPARPAHGRDPRPDPRDPHRVALPARPPADSLAGHRAIADAIRSGDPDAAAAAMHAHVVMVSDVAVLRDGS